MDQTFVFGADGGGTKTLGILATAGGKEIARHVVGPGNPNVAGVDGATRNLHELIMTCCRNGGCRPAELRSAVIGLAGVGSEVIREKLRNAVVLSFRDEGLNDRAITIETDARIGLEGAFGGECGVVIIAGTGSILIGKISPDTVVSVGGWGRLLGDEGSGFWMGVEALKAVARDIDGRGESPYLRAALAEKLGWKTRAAILDAVYQQKFEIPSVAPLVLDGMAAGDSVCASLLQQGADHLTSHLSALVRKMGEAKSVGVVFVGGLIDHETPYARVLRDTITHALPRAEVRQALYSPAWGAVLMAMRNQVGGG
jgi:N-acetylglucosamine kinase-like BadF-type ATPase